MTNFAVKMRFVFAIQNVKVIGVSKAVGKKRKRTIGITATNMDISRISPWVQVRAFLFCFINATVVTFW